MRGGKANKADKGDMPCGLLPGRETGGGVFDEEDMVGGGSRHGEDALVLNYT